VHHFKNGDIASASELKAVPLPLLPKRRDLREAEGEGRGRCRGIPSVKKMKGRRAQFVRSRRRRRTETVGRLQGRIGKGKREDTPSHGKRKQERERNQRKGMKGRVGACSGVVHMNGSNMKVRKMGSCR